jgi:glucosamine-6-phosphate deaminase
MDWIPVKDGDEMVRQAVRRMHDVISGELSRKGQAVIGLATGNTMLKVYSELANALNATQLDLSGLLTFNLDEYVDNAGGSVPADHPLSYRAYMIENFFSKIDPRRGLRLENMCFPDPVNPAAYDARIKELGGLDFQLLGIGFNGHIAFNEPINVSEISAEAFAALPTRVIQLADMTIRTNAALTANGDLTLVPHQAVTMGMQTILEAKEIMLLACFKEQAVPLAKIKTGAITPELPASFLLAHPRAQIIYTTDVITLAEEN